MSGSFDGERPTRDRCTTADGVPIATYDFGGGGPDLLFVHATGFCAEVFVPLTRALRQDFHCWGIDLRAHGRSGRPTDGDFSWAGFALDVLAGVDHLGLDHPYAFGHSCGGASILLAEEAQPGTFASLYCYEPVVFPGQPAAPGPPGELSDNPLSNGARRRRETFPSAEEAFLNFSSKPPFRDLDPEALRWYVDGGFEPVPAADGGDGDAVRLRCRRDDEAEVYAMGGSHDAYLHLGKITCPVTLACGADTDSFGVGLLEADASQLPIASVEVLPSMGHFGPLQDPIRVAASVEAALSTVDGTPPS